MSFMLTTEQVRNRTKTVTRRLGWWFLKPGDILNAVEKCQGLKKGEKIHRICRIQVVQTRIEPLRFINDMECIREGFPEWRWMDFVEMFCAANKCNPDTMVNRIEFEYLMDDQEKARCPLIQR
jgi:hypothetical protein